MNAAAAALVVLNGRQAFDPRASLFAHNEPGFWYDPSDLSSMYQDSAGTTPVTAVEQAVGLLLDKLRGYVLGGDLAVNGAFAADSDWTKGTGWSIGSGVATKTAGSAAALSQTITSTTGRAYLISATITRTAGTLTVSIGTSGTSAAFTASYTGTFVVFAGSSTQTLSFSGDASFAGTVDNVIVRELAGNHAIQPTSANRPILRSRYNLLLNTGFAGAAPGTPGTAPTSWAFGSATGSISAVNGDQLSFSTTAQRIFIQQSVSFAANSTYRATFTIHANSGVFLAQLFTWSQSISGASETLLVNGVSQNPITYVPVAGDQIDFRLTLGATAGSASVRFGLGCSDVSTATATTSRPDIRLLVDNYLPSYQRVTSATDYDTVGFPVYLAFDGSDDSLYTGGNVDFSATDKMTVWAGVTKLSDAANGVIFESSGSPGTDNGVVGLQAPGGTPASEQAVWRSRGTNSAFAIIASGYSAPVTSVLTGIGDISGDSALLRSDGVQLASSTGDQGTGNFGSYPLYIGRRNNASNPFNGRLYQLIGRGAATSAALLSQADRWVAGKQGRAL